MTMFICPVCKEPNEEHRNYCKECGTWLLSTNFPSEPMKGSNHIQQNQRRKKEQNQVRVQKNSGLRDEKYATYTYQSQAVSSSSWLIVIFIIGTIMFLLMALLVGKGNLFSVFAIFGLGGLGLTALLGLLFAVLRKVSLYKKELGVLLVTSVVSIIVSFVLTPADLSAGKFSPGTRGNESVQDVQHKIGESVNVGNLSYQVSQAYQQQKIESRFGSIATEGIFVIINLGVTNNDKEARYIDQSMFKLYDSEGRSFDPDPKADIYLNNEVGFFLKNINPGLSKQAKVAFELPLGATDLKLGVSSGFGWSGEESEFIYIGN